MYDIDLIKNLLIKTAVNGQYSVCDTCIHQVNDKSCRYMEKGKCSDKLDRYVPNKDVINFII